ncbi:MAG: PAS domain S-box protein [Ignavibacteria bacterium]|jgi:PAS domain S-box-containing protein
MKKEKLHILILEDNENDLALLIRELKKGKYEIDYKMVEDSKSFKSAISKKWDLIISDYSLPDFNGFEALNICNEKGIDTPFIVVSGTVGEDIAVDMMRAGCKDYIMKKSLKRLLPAVEREIEDARIREKNKLIDKEKEVLFEINQDILNTANLDELLKRIHINIGKVIYAKNCYIAIYDSERDELSFPFYIDKYDPPPITRKNGKGFTEYVLKTGSPLVVSSENIDEFAKINRLEMKGTIPESWLGVPLKSHSKPIGVIVIVSYEKNIIFTDAEKNFLTGIANQIALAIEKKQAEQSIKESEERFKMLFDKAPLGYQSLDKDGYIIEVNNTWIETLGYSKEEVIGKWFGDFLAPEYANSFKETFQIFKSKGKIHSEYEMIKKDGSHIYAAFEGRIGHSSTGEFIQTHCVLNDITEKKWIEDNLKKSEEHYRTLLSAIPDLMFRLDSEGRFIDYHADNITPLISPPKIFLGKHYREILPPEISEKYEKTIKKIKETGEIEKFEYENLLPNNESRFYEARITCFGDECISIIRDVTEQKNAEKALVESENKYRTIFENVQDIFYQADNNGIILDISPSIFKYSGYTRDELIGNSIDIFYFTPDDRIQFLNEVTKKGQVTDYEVTLKSKNGKIVYTSVNAHIYYDSNGNPIGVEGSLRDVSERKSIEEALKESEEQYRKLFELSPETIFVQCEGNIEFINPAGLKLFKANNEDEIIGKKVVDFVHPDYIENVSKRISILKKDFVDIPLNQVKYICLDGSIVDVEVIATPFMYKGKRAALVVLRNITDRKKSEEALKESEERYRILIETMNDGVMQVDNYDRIQFVNNSMCEMFGYTYHELIGKVGTDTIIFKEDREIVNEKNRIRLAGVSEKHEIRGIKKSGEIIWLSLSGTPIGDKDGNVIGSVGFLTDITERKRAEEEVIKISQAIKQSPVTILITDINGEIEYVNPKFIEVTGYRPEEVIGKTPRILKSDDKSLEEYKELWQTISSGKDWIGEFHNKKKNGELYWEKASISPVKNSEGKITHFLAVKEDITEKKQKEIELISAKEKAEESERLKSSFLANMSHELRTPMVGILGFAELMKDIAENPELKDFADNITKSGKRLLETLNLILDLSRIEAGKLEIKTSEVDIVQLTKEVFNNYVQEAEKKDLKIKFTSSEKQIVCKLDERMLWESINNLINNAIKYTKAGEVSINVNSNKNKAYIKVKDTGIGIPKESLNTIFDEFRQVSEGYSRGFEGTGLGLTITRNFIVKNGGKISVESEIGIGSVFTIELPVEKSIGQTKEKIIKDIDVAEKEYFPEKRNVQLLCVDDDSFTREYLEYILKNVYDISFAENGLTAIEMAKSQRYSLILMDINLGKGMDGIETTRKIRKLPGYNNIPVIAMTAFAMKGDREEFLNGGMKDYISKPFKSDELIKMIEKVIAENPQ